MPKITAPIASEGDRLDRRTQYSRSASTRLAINDATIHCLIVHGSAGTTMNAVPAAAGVSRGAVTYHYASKGEMLLAAVDHVASRIEEHARVTLDQLPVHEDRPRAVLALMWDAFKGDLFYASLELWTAARTDSSLRDAVRTSERALGKRHRGLLAELFGPEVSTHPNFELTLELTLDVMRGMALTGILRDDPRREQELIDAWALAFTELTRTRTRTGDN